MFQQSRALDVDFVQDLLHRGDCVTKRGVPVGISVGPAKPLGCLSIVLSDAIAVRELKRELILRECHALLAS